MNRSWALISVFALFVAGVSVGALGMHLYQERAPWGIHRPFFGPPGGGFLGRLEGRLNLTAEQKEKIADIRRESWRNSESLRRELRPRLEKHMQATRDKILAVLTPEQREKLEKLIREEPWSFHHFFLGGEERGAGHHPFGGPLGPPPEDAPPPEPPQDRP